MKYCCEKMNETIRSNLGLYPPDEESEEWSVFITGRQYYVSAQVVDIFYCPFCGKELKDLGEKQ